MITQRDSNIFSAGILMGGVLTIMGFCLGGCSITIPPAVIDAVVAAQTNSPALPPSLTNIVPATAQAEACGCDLTLPLCDPPYTPLWLDQQGNDTECPLPHGMDIRGKCLYPSINQRYSLHILKHLVSGKDAQGMIQGKCATVEGYRYHFTGYAHNRDKDPIAAKAGEPFPYKTTTMVWHDCRVAK